MNEEEKFVIKTLKDSQNAYIENTKVKKVELSTDEAKVVLNLIEKQQKELEQIEKEHKEENGRLREENKKLQEFYEKYYDSINSELNGLLTHKFIGYIPISKIKEKYLNMEREYSKKVYDKKYNRKEVKKEEFYKRQVYEELLEESDK